MVMMMTISLFQISAYGKKVCKLPRVWSVDRRRSAVQLSRNQKQHFSRHTAGENKPPPKKKVINKSASAQKSVHAPRSPKCKYTFLAP